MTAIAVTVGEPAGVGPELCLRLSERRWPLPLVLIGDKTALDIRAAALGLPVVPEFLADAESPRHPISIWNHPLPEFVMPGTLNPQNSREVLYTLDTAIHGCLSGYFAAMVTAPVHKGAINDGGIAFMGHTEYLAARTNTPRVVMMLVGGSLRVALVTTHLPLKDVPAAVDATTLTETLTIVARDLSEKFGIAKPRIAVCGLNPHAGEGGYLGTEERDVIEPVIDELLSCGLQVYGPYPADTIFVAKHASEYDAIVAMYHDQGLPVLKRDSFGAGVNVTLGLPFVRTSVDHGTALDLAGTGRADPGSLYAALELAVELAAKKTRTGAIHDPPAVAHPRA